MALLIYGTPRRPAVQLYDHGSLRESSGSKPLSLTVNADCHSDGKLAVEVLDAKTGQPIPWVRALVMRLSPAGD